MERLINILKQNEKITDWIVVNTESKSNEVFLIKDKVDMNRSCVTNETSVRVFVDFEENGDKFKGDLSLIHISEPTRQDRPSRMPSSA